MGFDLGLLLTCVVFISGQWTVVVVVGCRFCCMWGEDFALGLGCYRDDAVLVAGIET